MSMKFINKIVSKKKISLQLITLTAIIGSNLVAYAADNVVGTGSGVALGTTSSAPSTGDIAIGHNAKVHNYMNHTGSIVIGENAYAENMVGTQEKALGFRQAEYEKKKVFFFEIEGNTPKDATKLINTVVIGNNNYARSGGTSIGSHKYKGKLGDMDIDTFKDKDKDKDKDKNLTRNYALGVLTTSVGANNFANGGATTNIGAYSIMSSKYDGSNAIYATQNFGASSVGAFNSIESYSSGNALSGIANTIQGIANRTQNSNGSILIGAGNEITNSIRPIYSVDRATNTATELAEALRGEIRDREGAGSTLAIGGGNKADYTFVSQLIGVNNKIIGSANNQSSYTLLNGYKNTATETNHVIVIGNENKATKASHSILLGDNNTLNEGVANTFVLGNGAEVRNSNNVILGNDSADKTFAQVTEATITNKDNKQYTINHFAGTATGVVSVGDKDKERQIVNVAPGAITTTSTDAINGSQLYALASQMDQNSSGLEQITATTKQLQQDTAAVGQEVKRVGALSAALASLHPMQFDQYKPSQIMIGFGGYKNSKAIALGATRYFTEDFMGTLGLAFSQGTREDSLVNFGFTYKFGKKTARKVLPKEYKMGPLSSIYTMQEEMTSLKQENAKLQAKVDSQQSEINILKAQMAELLAKK